DAITPAGSWRDTGRCYDASIHHSKGWLMTPSLATVPGKLLTTPYQDSHLLEKALIQRPAQHNSSSSICDGICETRGIKKNVLASMTPIQMRSHRRGAGAIPDVVMMRAFITQRDV
ncbi:hypothetical protein, partial [Aeromonas caviae]|uniref:hypothetical protein n=1 Tax=Aeromonas caviae TaxID=648 RepID=UPI002B4747BE